MLDRALVIWNHPWNGGRAEEKNHACGTPVDAPAPVGLVARKRPIPSRGWTAKDAFQIHPNAKADETVQ